MKIPTSLNDGGTIGVVAPSFGATIEPYKSAFENAKKTFEKKGYSLDISTSCYKDDGIGISSTPSFCASELVNMYESKNNDILISCGGGELMCEILPYIDFKRLENAAPKWFVGYSDNTNFTFLLATILDTASIYGSCAPTYGMKKWHKVLDDTFLLLRGETSSIKGYEKWEISSKKDKDNPLSPYNLTEDKVLKTVSYKEPFKGRLLGGCLDTLLTLCGTKFDKVSNFIKKYEEDGVIWFLESCDLSVLQIKRGLWQLKMAGWFENAKGFIIGRPYNFYDEAVGLDRHLAVTTVLEELNLPIILDADLGHLPPSLPIITGAYANVSILDENIVIDYKI